jgi:hypothetical protein
MVEQSAVAHRPASEAVATTGLLLNVASLIAIAVCLASWGASESAVAGLAAIAAVLAFVASLVCFSKQAD